MTKLAIQVLMYPHVSKQQSFQQFSWHQPGGITVRLKAKRRRLDLETDVNGLASGTVPKGTYELSLPTLPRFAYALTAPVGAGAAAKSVKLKVSGKGQQEELHVVPAGKKLWLVPLRLTRAPAGRGKRRGVVGADVKVQGAKLVTSLTGGNVYGTGKAGDVTVKPREFSNLAPVSSDFVVRTDQEQESIDVIYQPRQARITIKPKLRSSGSKNPAIPGVTFELSRDGQESALTQVTQGSQACVFSDLPPGQVTVRAVPPGEYNGSLVELIGKTDCVPVNLAAGDDLNLSRFFRFKYPTGHIRGRVVDSDDKPLDDIQIVASSNGQSASKASDKKGKYSIPGLRAGEWTLRLGQSTVQVGSETLMAQPEQQVVSVQAGKTTKASDFKLEPDEHGIRGNVRDSSGKPVPYAIIEIRDQRMRVIDTVVANEVGAYSWRSPSSGMFVVNLLTRDGRTVQRETVTVNSWAPLDLIATDLPDGSGPHRSATDGSADGTPATGPSGGAAVREAFTDLAAYPVLTEEVSTTGAPGARWRAAPAVVRPARATGRPSTRPCGTCSAGGPSGDLAGFQAALTGAFQLREVEGHTAWTWQQRGYAVQADMGALTGAQASIYARAKSALDQILPLLAGLTTLNPALYPPQDLRGDPDRRRLPSSKNSSANSRWRAVPGFSAWTSSSACCSGTGVGSINLESRRGPGPARHPAATLRADRRTRSRRSTTSASSPTSASSSSRSWPCRRAGAPTASCCPGGFADLSRDHPDLALPGPGSGVRIGRRSHLRPGLRLRRRGTAAGDRARFERDGPSAVPSEEPRPRRSLGQSRCCCPTCWTGCVRASRDEGPSIIQDAGKDGVLRLRAGAATGSAVLVRATRQAARGTGRPAPRDADASGRAAPSRCWPPSCDEADRPRRPRATATQRPRDHSTCSGDRIRRGAARADPNRLLTGANFRPPASAVLNAQNREDIPECLRGTSTFHAQPQRAADTSAIRGRDRIAAG